MLSKREACSAKGWGLEATAPIPCMSYLRSADALTQPRHAPHGLYLSCRGCVQATEQSVPTVSACFTLLSHSRTGQCGTDLQLTMLVQHC